MAFEPGDVVQMEQRDGIEGGEVQFNIECQYNNCYVYDVFNVIQFDILFIDIGVFQIQLKRYAQLFYHYIIHMLLENNSHWCS